MRLAVPLLSKRRTPLSSLTYEELERICDLAEEAARRYIASKVPKEGISDLTITVSIESSESLNVDVDVEVRLSPLYGNLNVKELARGSVKAAFEAIEEYLKQV
jgi:hypothetical protein